MELVFEPLDCITASFSANKQLYCVYKQSCAESNFQYYGGWQSLESKYWYLAMRSSLTGFQIVFGDCILYKDEIYTVLCVEQALDTAEGNVICIKELNEDKLNGFINVDKKIDLDFFKTQLTSLPSNSLAMHNQAFSANASLRGNSSITNPGSALLVLFTALFMMHPRSDIHVTLLQEIPIPETSKPVLPEISITETSKSSGSTPAKSNDAQSEHGTPDSTDSARLRRSTRDSKGAEAEKLAKCQEDKLRQKEDAEQKKKLKRHKQTLQESVQPKPVALALKQTLVVPSQAAAKRRSKLTEIEKKQKQKESAEKAEERRLERARTALQEKQEKAARKRQDELQNQLQQLETELNR